MYKNFRKVRLDSRVAGDTLEESPEFHPSRNPKSIIVKDFANGMTIKAFNTSEDLFSYISTKRTSLHEVVIDGTRPVKLFLDLDAKREELDNSDDLILSYIIEAIAERLFAVARDEFHSENESFDWVVDNLLIWSACDEKKFSYHLIVNQMYFSDMKNMKAFVDSLTPNLRLKGTINNEEEGANKVIDNQYHNEKSLRCPHSEKYSGTFLGRPLEPLYCLDKEELDADPRVFKYNLFDYDPETLFSASLITEFKPVLGQCIFIDGLASSKKSCQGGQEREISLEELPEKIRGIVQNFIPLENIRENRRGFIQKATNREAGDLYKNYKISYRRIRPNEPQYCPVCEEDHHYNTLYALVNEISAVMLCSKANRGLSKPRKLLWEKAPANKKEEAQIKGFKTFHRIQGEVKMIRNYDTPRLPDNIKFHETLKVNEPLLSKGLFDGEGDKLVISPMGTGKSKALSEYLGPYKPKKSTLNTPRKKRGIIPKEKPEETPKKVLIVSFRKSFTDSLGAKYQAKDYRSFEGRIDFERDGVDRVICQVESLHKVNIPKHLDLVIIDEIESVCMQFSNKIMTKFGTLQNCVANLQSLLLVANKVIYMDAFAGERTLAFIEKVGRKARLDVIQNVYKPKNKRLELLYRESHFNKALNEALKVDKKVVIATTSKNKSKNLKAFIHSEFPKKVVKIYNSETNNSERKALSDPHLAWSQADVLIYTQTISAGISFELDHFDVLLGWMTSINSDYITVAQMISRVRNVSDYKIYFAGGYNDIPCSEDALVNYLINAKVSQNELINDSFSNVGATASKLGIQSDYLLRNKDGWYINPNKKDLYYTLWLQNTRVMTKSKNALRKEFLKIFSIYCSDITCPKPELAQDDSEKELNKKHRSIERKLKRDHAKGIAEAPNINKDNYNDLKGNLKEGRDLKPLEVLSMEKFKLAQILQKDVQEIEPEDIKKGSNRAKIRTELNKKEMRTSLESETSPFEDTPKEPPPKPTLKERLIKQTKSLLEPDTSDDRYLTYSILFKGERNLAKIQIFNILSKMWLAKSGEKDLVDKVFSLEELADKFAKITSEELSKMIEGLTSYFKENELLLRRLFEIQSCYYPREGWGSKRSFLGTINKIVSELGFKLRSLDKKGREYEMILQ